MADENENPNDRLRARGWCFTWNNYTEDDEALVFEMQHMPTILKYAIAGKEVCPTTGTRHMQGYIYFIHKKSMQQVSNFFPTRSTHVFWSRAKGTSAQNRAYCSKDNDYWEHGEAPLDAKAKGQIEKERWDRAKENAINGNMRNIDSDILVRCYGQLCQIKKDFMANPENAEDVTGLWIQGPAGCGKSRYARETFTPFFPCTLR